MLDLPGSLVHVKQEVPEMLDHKNSTFCPFCTMLMFIPAPVLVSGR